MLVRTNKELKCLQRAATTPWAMIEALAIGECSLYVLMLQGCDLRENPIICNRFPGTGV